MRREGGDAAWLHDILRAGQAIERFLKGKTPVDFAGDELLRGGVERKLEIIGEAARRLSQGFRDGNPHIPWKKVMGTRHILAHDYDDVDEEIVWRIATIHVPELLRSVTPLIPPPPPDPEPKV
jgi:uncharacterized protein with HEPN domain